MCLHELDHFRQGIFFDENVWIDDERILTSRSGKALVVGTSEKHIITVIDILDRRKTLSDYVTGAVRRYVVDNQDFDRNSLSGLHERLQTLNKLVPGVVGRNNA